MKKLWKDMMEDLLEKKVPMHALLIILNMVRMKDLLYKDEGTYTHAETGMKELVASILVDPAPYELI
ncbi:Probable terpene synthase 3 [Linum grandiflorum]